MLVGFLDGQGRTYDLTFRTLKRRLRDAEGNWEAEPGESFHPAVSVEVALFLAAEKTHLLLRPTSGLAVTSGKRFLFLAGDGVPRTTDEPTAFNVAMHVPPTAVDHLFREAGGREIVEVRREEIRGMAASRAELALQIEAPWIGSGERPASFRGILRPIDAAQEAVAPLRLSFSV